MTEGVVHSIREIHVGNPRVQAQPPPPQQAGLHPDLDTGHVVGSVAARPFGTPGREKWQFGAAGTPEMQARFAQTGYEVVVTMDDGERRVFRPREGARFGIGQRVGVRSGELEPI